MPPEGITSPTPTRERLIEAATELFRLQGIRATSLEQVAAHAGVHRVTLHRWFRGGRDELVAEVIVRAGLEAAIEAVRRDAEHPTIQDLLVETLTGMVLLGRSDPMLREALCSDAARLAMAPDRLTAVYEFAVSRRETLDQIARQDAFEFPHDPRRIADLWARTVLTLVREPGIVDTEDDVRAYVTDFVLPALVRPASDAG